MRYLLLLSLIGFLAISAQAETFDCYYRKSDTRFGVIVIENNKADLLFWGPHQSEYKNLDVKREGRRIIIDFPYEYLPYYPAEPFVSPIILRKRRLARGYKYFFIHERINPEICYQTQ